MTATPTLHVGERREAISELIDGVHDGMDFDALDRWRALAASTPGHDLCAVNANSLRRLVNSIDALAILALDPPTFPVSEDAARECLQRVAESRSCDVLDERHVRVVSIGTAIAAMLAFRGSGVAPHASGAPLRGQALGPADPEPVPVSALPGDDPSRVTLVGHLEWQGSKRGERYFNIECPLPYVHTAFVTIYGDEGREGDDDLTNDLFPHLDCKVSIECSVDTDGYLISRPSWIAPASAMSGRSPETEGLSPKGASATAEGGDAQNTPDPTPLSGKD